MSRLTLGNVIKVTTVLVFLPLLAYLVLVIGTVRKDLRAALEGVLYAGAFSTAVFALDLWGPPALLALAAMGASGVRSWHLRDLWLPARRRWRSRPGPASTTGDGPAATGPAGARSGRPRRPWPSARAGRAAPRGRARTPPWRRPRRREGPRSSS